MEQIASQDKSIIKAYPTKELFISILIRDVTIRDAIGDLLDNAVDGARRLRPDNHYDGLYVHIEFCPDQDYFTITDNCGGIPVSVARDFAFRFGRPDGAEQTGHSIGVFGIGMKRALFRLGKKFAVESMAERSSFKMKVDVEKWKMSTNEPSSDEETDKYESSGVNRNGVSESSDRDEIKNWQFKFQQYDEEREEEYPEKQRGTKITVTGLNPDVKAAFALTLEVDALIGELQREHLYSIDEGLEITVNRTRLEAPELKLLVSDDFKTAYWENSDGPVQTRIYAGIAEQDTGLDGGWYVFCNNRLILGPDQTSVTGWGAKSPVRIPEYHSQFYRFRGYAFLRALDPQDLPWNTAKTSLGLDSPVYRSVRQQMILLMRTVIDFLNQLHVEKGNYDNEKIDETPLHNAIADARLVSLSTVRTTESHLSFEKFVAPEPAKPTQPKPSEVWIRYAVSTRKYELVKQYFDADEDKPGEIGLKIFDYFFAREIKD